jgi:hypothetical protein
MPACSCPIPIWSAPPTENKHGRQVGKTLFNPRGADQSQPMRQVPCGKCRNCLRERSAEWGTRVACEVQLHPVDECWFLGMTYAPEHLPHGCSLWPLHVDAFIDRIRAELGPVRYLLSGEYAPDGRPHYHMCAFGLSLPDMQQVGTSGRGHPLYGCDALSALWPHGIINAGRVSAKAGAYVASYALKGQRKRESRDYDRVDFPHLATGKLFTGRVVPEFVRMSLRPGIGAGYVERFSDELLASDFLVIEGRRVQLPRYFDKLLERDHFDRFELLKAARLERSAERQSRELARRFNGSNEAQYMHLQTFSDHMARHVAIADLERGQ